MTTITTQEIELSEKHIDLISHSLGINYYNAKVSDERKYKFLPDEFYRNYYCVGYEHQFNQDMIYLEQIGFIKKWMRDKQLFFCITDEGIAEFKKVFIKNITLTYVPLSKTKQQYREYLHMESSDSFADFLGIRLPREEKYSGLIRYVSTKYPEVKGEYCLTKKEAKATYKKTLNERLKSKNN